jgi:hypothetical protein
VLCSALSIVPRMRVVCAETVNAKHASAAAIIVWETGNMLEPFMDVVGLNASSETPRQT